MQNRSFILIGFWLIILPLQTVQAQVTQKLTVKQSVKMALEHSYQLQAAEADVEATEAEFRKTRSRRLPSLSGQASYMRLSDNIPEVDFSPPGADTTFTILPVELDQFHSELRVEQLLFAGGRLNNQIESADHQAEAAGFIEKQERANIAFEVRKAYWKLYQAQAEHKVIQSALKRVTEHLENVRNKVEAGAALRTDVLNAKSRRSEVLLDQVESRGQVRVARLELNRLLGLPADVMVDLVSPDTLGTIPLKIEELKRYALKERPGLQALSEQVEVGEANIEATKGDWFPRISLVGRYVYARPNQYFFAQQDQFKGTWEAGVRLRWNLWSGGQRSAEISQARARLRKAEAQLADKKEQATVEVSRQYFELKSTAEAIDAAAHNVKAAKEAFESMLRQYQEGAVLSEQVLDAQHAYRKAQARHAQVLADYEIAYAAVLNALGQIWKR